MKPTFYHVALMMALHNGSYPTTMPPRHATKPKQKRTTGRDIERMNRADEKRKRKANKRLAKI